ncbi:hypothetical protein [Baaleninema simplex]|uniref:hypothetical protein n=1 Tax=Baaleninema simplex TaxID=2862350 RepID=UPI0003494AAB|nr:hypothetical protein [Baaleninema simplex]
MYDRNPSQLTRKRYDSTLPTQESVPRKRKLPTSRLGSKRLGAYLLEAGLLSPGQIQVATYDQQVTGKKFSEVIVDRGWVKQQTIDFLIKRVIVPEQRRAHSSGAFAQPIEPFSQVYERRKEEVLQESEEEVPWTVD